MSQVDSHLRMDPGSLTEFVVPSPYNLHQGRYGNPHIGGKFGQKGFGLRQSIVVRKQFPRLLAGPGAVALI